MGVEVTKVYYCDHCRHIVLAPTDLIRVQVSKESPFDPMDFDDRCLAVCVGCFKENPLADMIPDFGYRGMDHATREPCSAISGESVQLSTVNC
jgi:hypothetical protein